MTKENLIKLRTVSLMVFSLGALCFVITMLTAGDFLFFLSALVAFSGMSCFLYTEAFFYSTEERTPFNIWIARLLFIISIPIILAILVALLS